MSCSKTEIGLQERFNVTLADDIWITWIVNSKDKSILCHWQREMNKSSSDFLNSYCSTLQPTEYLGKEGFHFKVFFFCLTIICWNLVIIIDPIYRIAQNSATYIHQHGQATILLHISYLSPTKSKQHTMDHYNAISYHNNIDLFYKIFIIITRIHNI